MLSSVLTAPVEPGAYVTVIGEVVRFEPAEVAAKMKGGAPELPAEAIAKYRGRPAIVATSIINGAMTDLAKRLPPPMSPEEEALSRQMKQIGPGFNALRQAVTAANSADAAAQAAALNKAFTEAAAFWKGKTHRRRDPVDRGCETGERRDRRRRRARRLGRSEGLRAQTAVHLLELPRPVPRAAGRRDLSIQAGAAR